MEQLVINRIIVRLCSLLFRLPANGIIPADVRMRYQNKNMYLPLCAADGKHLPGSPEFCTLRAFRERVKELTPDDWEMECAPGGR